MSGFAGRGRWLLGALAPLLLGACQRSTESLSGQISTREGCEVRVGGRTFRGEARDVGLMTVGQSSEEAVRQRLSCLGPGFDFSVEFPEVPLTEAIEMKPVLPAGSYTVISPEASAEESNERSARVVLRILSSSPDEPETRWNSVEGEVQVGMPELHEYRLRVQARVRE